MQIIDKYKEVIAAHFNVDSAQVVALRVYEDHLNILIDYGIGGIKKYTMPLPVARHHPVNATRGALSLCEENEIDPQAVQDWLGTADRVGVQTVRDYLEEVQK